MLKQKNLKKEARAGTTGPRPITELLGCFAKELGFMRQRKSLHVVSCSSAFPEQPSWLLASPLVCASTGGGWEIGTIDLIYALGGGNGWRWLGPRGPNSLQRPCGLACFHQEIGAKVLPMAVLLCRQPGKSGESRDGSTRKLIGQYSKSCILLTAKSRRKAIFYSSLARFLYFLK